MIAELHRRGWRPTKTRVLHDTAEVGEMVSREATKIKVYYVVLLEIHRCIPLSSTIPSDQPIAFFQMFLNGVAVEPGLGNSRYIAILRGHEHHVAEFPPIEGEDSDEESKFKKYDFLFDEHMSHFVLLISTSQC